MPAPRAPMPLLLAGLLLLASPAAAKVVEVAPGAAAEKGGTPTSSKAAPCPCPIVLPFGPFGWFGLAEAEMLARWAAPIGTALAAERVRWRAPRIAGRPRPGQTARSLRVRGAR